MSLVTSDQELGRARLSFRGIVVSEWIKFFSVRSSYLVLGLFILVTAGFNTVLCLGLRLRGDPQNLAEQHLSVMVAQLTAVVGTLVVGVLGVLAITTEYSSGQIRTSLWAVPRRLPVLWAKAVVVAFVAAWAAVVTIILSYLVGWLLLRHSGIDLSLTRGQNDRILVGIILFVVTITVLGLMVGALIRSTAGALAAVVTLTFVLPVIANLVRGALGVAPTYSLVRRLVFYSLEILPTAAGQPLLSWTTSDTSSRVPTLHLTAWTGLAVMWAWVVVVAVPAVIRLRTRDA